MPSECASAGRSSAGDQPVGAPKTGRPVDRWPQGPRRLAGQEAPRSFSAQAPALALAPRRMQGPLRTRAEQAATPLPADTLATRRSRARPLGVPPRYARAGQTGRAHSRAPHLPPGLGRPGRYGRCVAACQRMKPRGACGRTPCPNGTACEGGRRFANGGTHDGGAVTHDGAQSRVGAPLPGTPCRCRTAARTPAARGLSSPPHARVPCRVTRGVPLCSASRYPAAA